MKNKISRNDPCSCGSGIKYKKCCMNKHSSAADSDVLDHAWLNLRKTEGAIIDNHLVLYADKKLPEGFIKTALEDFCFEDLPKAMEEHEKKLLFTNFFMPWLFFNWIPYDDFGLDQFDPEKTIAQNYAKIHKDKLTAAEKRFIDAISNTYYSFYSVLEVEFEQSLVVKDIMLGTTHTIKERQATHRLKRGDIIFSRILTLDNCSIFIGMAPFTMPSRYHIDLVDFKRELIEENDNNNLTATALRDEFDIELREYFFEVMNTAFNMPLPKLVNTDGDPIHLSKTHFRLDIVPEEALRQLLPLTLSEDIQDFLDDAERDESGTIKRIRFPWLKEGNEKHKSWDNTVMGQVTLEDCVLILETNSSKRTEQGNELLNKYLGGAITFQQTLMESPEYALKNLPKEQIKSPTESELLASPEAQKHIKKMMNAHWEDWFDQPIPALDNKTPREAAKTESGREKLDALLLHYEHHDQKSGNNLFKADIKYLKKKLYLD